MKQQAGLRDAICAAFLLVFATATARAETASGAEAPLTLRKAAAAVELQNLMGRRSKKREIHWAQNQGCWVGMKSLKVYYDDVNRKMQAAELERLSKANPKIRNVPQNRFIGNTVLHVLTTPIIEVADDLQSAKGVWYTPGMALSAGDGITPQAYWIWERYGVDFIREDGKWVLLNVQVNTDFISPMGKPLTLPESSATMGSESSQAQLGPGPDGIVVPGPDIPVPTYQDYSVTRVPSLVPRLPEPYKTLAATFQYADCKK
jgi:hypothetical protein